MKAHDDLTFNVIGATMAYYDLIFNVIGATMVYYNLTFNVIGATMAYYDLTFNVIGATIESLSQNPPLLAYINQEFVAIKQNCLDGTPVASDCLSLAARRGAGLVDSRLTSPRDPLALLREVPLPLSFCGAPPAETGVQRGARSRRTEVVSPCGSERGATKDPRLVAARSSPLEEYRLR